VSIEVALRKGILRMGGKLKPRQAAKGGRLKPSRIIVANGEKSPLTRIYLPDRRKNDRLRGRYGDIPSDSATGDRRQ